MKFSVARIIDCADAAGGGADGLEGLEVGRDVVAWEIVDGRPIRRRSVARGQSIWEKTY